MSRSFETCLEHATADALTTLASAKEAAIRDRAFELGHARKTAPDEIRDWLDAERSLCRRPNLRLSLDGKHYRFEIELPGLRAEDITVRLGGDRMIIEGKRSGPPTTPLVDELGATHWWREQRLPTDARTTDAEVSLADGILVLTLVRAAPLERASEEIARTAPVAPTASAIPAASTTKQVARAAAPEKPGRTVPGATKPIKKGAKPRTKNQDA